MYRINYILVNIYYCATFFTPRNIFTITNNFYKFVHNKIFKIFIHICNFISPKALNIKSFCLDE